MKVHLDDAGKPACRVGKRADVERLRSTEDGRLVTCLACRALVVERRRDRSRTNARAQGALLDVTVGRPNVVRLDDRRNRS